MKIEVNIDKKYFIVLLSAIIIIGGIIISIAYGTSTPSTFGHSVGEMDWNQNINSNVSVIGNLNVTGNIRISGNTSLGGKIYMANGIIFQNAWPDGNYCILRAGGACPTGFSTGNIYIDAEDSNPSNSMTGSVGDSYANGNVYFNLCCK